MSRTEIHDLTTKMHKSPITSNAVDSLFLQNDVGLLENLAEGIPYDDMPVGEDALSLAGCQTADWLDDLGILDSVCGSNTLPQDIVPFNFNYSLDDLPNTTEMSFYPDANFSSVQLKNSNSEGSLSLSDERVFNIEEILSMVTGETEGNASDSEGLTNVSMLNDACLSPLSVDSGISCDELPSADTSISEDFFSNFLNSVAANIEEESQTANTMFGEGCTGVLQSSEKVGAEKVESSLTVRYQPYKKSKTTEQKLRKKAQNRTAATRYRGKKKVEMEEMFAEVKMLEDTNKDLKGKVGELKKEIHYLKDLMLDVIKARLANDKLKVVLNEEKVIS